MPGLFRLGSLKKDGSLLFTTIAYLFSRHLGNDTWKNKSLCDCTVLLGLNLPLFGFRVLSCGSNLVSGLEVEVSLLFFPDGRLHLS